MTDLQNLTVIDHPLIRHKLHLLRDRDTPTKLFRELVEEIATLMAYEVTRDLEEEEVEVRTPLEVTQGTPDRGEEARRGTRPAGRPRHGRRVCSASSPGRGSGTWACRATRSPSSRWSTTSSSRRSRACGASSWWIPCSPPAARPPPRSRGSRRAAPPASRFMCLVAAPEGVRALRERHPDVPVFAAALDRELDENGYILPGLGDAGDRLFGTK